jgi:Ca2+-binding RTX toxin-like protein
LKRVIVALTLVINLVACASPQNGLLRTATLASAGSGPVYGTKGDGILHAGAEDDDIWGGGGNDIIYGGSGNDSIHSGIGKDSVFGGRGSVDVCYVSYRDVAHGCEFLSLRSGVGRERTVSSTTS